MVSTPAHASSRSLKLKSFLSRPPSPRSPSTSLPPSSVPFPLVNTRQLPCSWLLTSYRSHSTRFQSIKPQNPTYTSYKEYQKYVNKVFAYFNGLKDTYWHFGINQFVFHRLYPLRIVGYKVKRKDSMTVKEHEDNQSITFTAMICDNGISFSCRLHLND